MIRGSSLLSSIVAQTVCVKNNPAFPAAAERIRPRESGAFAGRCDESDYTPTRPLPYRRPILLIPHRQNNTNMPELPEVETVRRGLVPSMEGVRIARVDVNRPDLRWPFPERMAERLVGQEVLRLRRRSKYILADLSSGESLLIHLGMSGRMTVSGDPLGQFVHEHPKLEKHDHVIIWMEGGARIAFNDPRRFGFMELIAPEETSRLDTLGPEPLSNAFNAPALRAASAAARGPPLRALPAQARYSRRII